MWREEELRRRYPCERDAVLAEDFGVCTRTIWRWAKKLGLEKDAEHARRPFRKGERAFSGELEEKRKEAIRRSAWEERKRILHGEPRKTGWRMVDYGKPQVGGKWQKA